MICVDFDDTLFDTHRLKDEQLRFAEARGIARTDFLFTYARARDNAAEGYSNEAHARMLTEAGYDYELSLHTLNNFLQTVRWLDLVSQEAMQFLERVRAVASPLLLLTVGSLAWQKMKLAKIEASGLVRYFDEVHVVSNKTVWFGEHISMTTPPIFFVNDNIEETKDAVSVHPEITPILFRPKHRSEAEYIQSGVPYFSSLNNIAAYVEQHTQ